MASETHRNGNVGVGEDNISGESNLSDTSSLPHPDIFLDFGPKGWWDNRKVLWGTNSKAYKHPEIRYQRRLGMFLSRMQEVAEQHIKRIYVEAGHLRPQETSKSQPFTLEELQEIDQRAQDLGLEIWAVTEHETHKARAFVGLPPKSTRDKEVQKKIRQEEGWVDAVAWEKYLPHVKVEPRRWRCPTKETMDANRTLNDIRDQARSRLNHYQRYEYSTESEWGWRIPAAEVLRDSLDLQPLERKIVESKPCLMTFYELTHRSDGTPYGLSSANLERLVGNYKPARKSKFRAMFFAPIFGRISILREEGYSWKELRKALRSVSKKFNSGGRGEYASSGESNLSDIKSLPAPRRKTKTQKEPVNA